MNALARLKNYLRPDQRPDGVFPISGFPVNQKTSNDIDMKFGLVTKLDKRNKIASKKLIVTSCR